VVAYIPIFIMVFVASLSALILVGASHILGERIAKKAKLSPYECGMRTVGPTRSRITIRYYIVAMLFLIFDIEILFLYPWAVVTRSLKLFGFIEMLIFVSILFIGYVYVWKKGALEWD